MAQLNPKQQEAVEYTEGPLLILAGAGSGKTSTMTHRIAHMVDSGIDPYHILAVTFTNKAANEMKERVEQLIGDTRGMWIMTFHAMCLRILHKYGDRLGYGSQFSIYDTSDQKTVVKNIMKERGISDKEYKPQYLLSAISHCKEKAQSPEDFRDVSLESVRNRVIHIVYEEYEKQLKENNAMDFDDLLLNCWRLLSSEPDVLEEYQERFRYIMVDEYQDTNHIQYELVTMLAEKNRNICVVGDDDQCIYQWRGADIRNILDFEKDFPEAKVIKLEQNYRSVGNILAAAHSVIRHNTERKSKKLWTDREPGEKIRYYRLDNDKEEASYVARQISALQRKGRDWNDFAILYRTNAQSRLFEEAMSREGIPYRVLSGMRYYDRKEIKDAMAYMRLVVNPDDDLSLQRIINEPKRGVGAKTWEKIRTFANVRGQSVLQALADPDGEVLGTLPGKAYDKVKVMTECLTLCRQEKDNLNVTDIFDQLMTRTGYMPALEAERTTEAESRLDNLMEFKSVIADYENSAEEPTIDEFMEQLALTAEVDNYHEEDASVTMMTMHSAKGLEFPVVFMPGMEDGLFPGSRAFDEEEKMEEERRLCYVGMTRAKELLFLTSAEVRTRYGRTDYTRESQFLKELDPKLIEGDAVYRRRQGDSSLGVSTGSRDGYAKQPAVKPYDALKYARMETRQHADASASSIELKAGDHVMHSKFGTGLVIDADEKIVTVAFDSAGIKKLARGIAPLKKI